jgi:hypothetical protein
MPTAQERKRGLGARSYRQRGVDELRHVGRTGDALGVPVVGLERVAHPPSHPLVLDGEPPLSATVEEPLDKTHGASLVAASYSGNWPNGRLLLACAR